MFWKRRAGPPGFADFPLGSLGGTAEAAVFTWAVALLARSVISAFSRMGSTSVWIRLSSPARSRAAIHWRRSSKGKGSLLGTDDYTDRIVFAVGFAWDAGFLAGSCLWGIRGRALTG